MENFKRRLYEIIEVGDKNDYASRSYDTMMLVAVIVGILPMTMKGTTPCMVYVNLITNIIFLFDYVSRVYTADYKLGYKSLRTHVAYVFTPMAIVDLLSLVPMLAIILPRSARVDFFVMFKVLRVVRMLKLVRYSKTMVIIENVLRRVKKELLTVLFLTFGYIIASALFIFQLEPSLFDTFFDALYWATISITTIGYGDISPVTTAGRMITMISALVGVAVIALPSGIITAGYMDEITRKKTKYEK